MSKYIIIHDFSDPDSIHQIDEAEAKLYDKAFVFNLDCEQEIRDVIKQRAALKKAFNDSMSLVYELVNKLIREDRR